MIRGLKKIDSLFPFTLSELAKMRIEGRDLIDLVLSWSLEEVLNVDLYKGQVLFYAPYLVLVDFKTQTQSDLLAVLYLICFQTGGNHSY